MSEQLHNSFQNLDDFLRNTLNNHQAELHPNLWGKMKSKLFKNDVSEFVRFKKFQKAFHPQCKSVSLQLKIWASYTAAACLMVGIVYGSSYYISNIIQGSSEKTEKEFAPLKINSANPDKNNSMDEQPSPKIINLPVISNNYEKLPAKQNNVVALNLNAPVKKNNQENSTSNNNLLDSTKLGTSKNFNTLINYIQRLNPQDKIVVTDNSDRTTEDPEPIVNNDFEIRDDAQENTIQSPVYQIEIPNVITPNGDGFNDMLVIKNLDKYTDNNLLIADRAGNVLFDKNSYQNDWDAKNIPDGTYYYILSYKDNSKNKGVIKGLITILRK
jgi:gliding motility-associated-like protein